MSRISEIRIKQTYPCCTVSIRKTIDFMSEYSAFFGEAIGLIGNYLDEIALPACSPAMAVFHNMELEHLDLEVGFQIAKKVPGNEKVSCQVSEACRVVSAIDLGPYEKQNPTLTELFDLLKLRTWKCRGLSGIFI